VNALLSFTGTTRLVLAHVSGLGAPSRRGGGDELLVAAYRRKDNRGRRTPAFALRLRFAPGGAVTVADAELAEAPDLLARTSVARRVTVALADHALTVAELAAEVGASKATVGRAVRRLREQGRVVLVDNVQPWRWELASR
jgi:DNA-directed RNA polymerase specialized sigma24 family protein